MNLFTRQVNVEQLAETFSSVERNTALLRSSLSSFFSAHTIKTTQDVTHVMHSHVEILPTRGSDSFWFVELRILSCVHVRPAHFKLKLPNFSQQLY